MGQRGGGLESGSGNQIKGRVSQTEGADSAKQRTEDLLFETQEHSITQGQSIAEHVYCRMGTNSCVQGVVYQRKAQLHGLPKAARPSHATVAQEAAGVLWHSDSRLEEASGGESWRPGTAAAHALRLRLPHRRSGVHAYRRTLCAWNGRTAPKVAAR